MELCTIYTALSRFEAHTIAAALQAKGIRAIIHADDGGDTGPDLAFAHGVQVLIRPDDFEAAKQVLAEDATSAE